MATSNSKFKIKPSPRSVICKGCNDRIQSGQLRIETVTGSGVVRNINHPGCFLGQSQGSSVQVPDDLDGWQLLSSQDQDSVRGLFPTTSTSPSSRPSVIINNPNKANTSQSNALIDLTQAPGPSTMSRNSPQTQKNSQPSHQNSNSSQNSLIDLTQSQGLPTSGNNSQSQTSSVRRQNSSSQPLLSSDSSLSRANSAARSNQSQQSWVSSQFSSHNSMIDLTDRDDSYDDYDYYDDSPALSLPSPKRPKLDRDSQGRPVMPDLLAGVTIPEGRDRDGEECSVCLDPPLHPVTLPCGHVFCFTCAKGLTQQQGAGSACSLCRQDIPADYLDSSQVISEALEDVDKENSQQKAWSWFYEGRNGWWKFEERNNDEIEETFLKGTQCLETLICGNLYVIDFTRMEQYQKNFPNRKRKIKRDLQSSDSKGIAGLHANKLKPLSQPGSNY